MVVLFALLLHNLACALLHASMNPSRSPGTACTPSSSVTLPHPASSSLLHFTSQTFIDGTTDVITHRQRMHRKAFPSGQKQPYTSPYKRPQVQAVLEKWHRDGSSAITRCVREEHENRTSGHFPHLSALFTGIPNGLPRPLSLRFPGQQSSSPLDAHSPSRCGLDTLVRR